MPMDNRSRSGSLGLFYMSDGAWDWRLTRSTFISRQFPAFNMNTSQIKGSLRLVDCTFIANAAPNQQVVVLNPVVTTLMDSTVVRNCIFYDYAASGYQPDAGTTKGTAALGLFFPSADSGKVFVSNNLYAYHGYTGTPGDRSLYGRRQSSALLYSGPLSNTTLNADWNLNVGSTFGSPQFDYGGPDSTVAAAVVPDVHIGPLSHARGIAVNGGSDAGALDFAGEALINLWPYAFARESPRNSPPDTHFVFISNPGSDSLRLSNLSVAITASLGTAVDVAVKWVNAAGALIHQSTTLGCATGAEVKLRLIHQATQGYSKSYAITFSTNVGNTPTVTVNYQWTQRGDDSVVPEGGGEGGVGGGN